MMGNHRVSRRTVLRTLSALGVAVASGFDPVTPQTAHAQALGQNETVEDAMKRLFGSKTIKDGSPAIKLDVPVIAENGAVVPVSVSVDSPMTSTSYVRHIYVLADKNRIPIVTRVTLAPEAGRAFMGANIRLGETGAVRASCDRGAGPLLLVQRESQVTAS